jgi:hypothetical protein
MMTPRITLRYEATPLGSGGAGDVPAERARAARARLNDTLSLLPRDCASVLIDVYGFEKGLQSIEAERGWPRRSAKLVLRIGLDRLAEAWGLGETARGPDHARSRVERFSDRVPMFGD